MAQMSDDEHPTQDRKDDTLDVNKLPKHMRLRYWTSWEEVYLVEMWRRYYSEVHTVQKNLPVFRKISDAMKDHGFYVNSQECRRKINVLKNKYIAERRRIGNDQEYKVSNWRLYTPIHCVLEPKYQINHLTHEEKTVNELLQNIAQETNATIAKITAAAAINPMDVAPYIHSNPSVAHNTTQASFTPNNNSQTIPPKRAYTPRRTHCRPTDNVRGILRKQFTLAGLEQMRMDNRRLLEQRDIALERLRIEENELKRLENYFAHWRQNQYQRLQMQCANKN